MARLAVDDELAAVAALARRLGLHGQPAVLKLAKHTTVRIGSSVARVRSTGESAWTEMAREVAVAEHLARHGAPAVRASVDPPAGPYEADGCVISLWRHARHRAADDMRDAEAAGAALKAVHAALAGYEGALPPFTDAIASAGALLADPRATPELGAEDRRFLIEAYDRGAHRLPDVGEPIALHGDTHLGNVLMTVAGPVWADLEAVCTGPLAWDLVNKPAAFLQPFGAVDAALLTWLGELRRVCVAAWCWADAGRSAETRAAAEHHLQTLRRGWD
jgi:hypothetical protein